MRIAIIGLGLIGGSIGLALGRTDDDLELVGFARRPEIASRAVDLGVVNRTEECVTETIHGADVVIITTPALAVREIMNEVKGNLKEGCIVTDVASTKAQVMEWAKAILPSTISFIGGHPMAGKEVSGIEAADADLFKGCTYCLVSDAEASKESCETMTWLVRQIGAKPLFIDAQEHDTLVAGISHLPLLASVALVSATVKSPLWSEMAELAASGYRDVTRLASGDPKMSHDICITNRESILQWIDVYIEELGKFRRLITQRDSGNGSGENSEELEAAFMKLRDERDSWLRMKG